MASLRDMLERMRTRAPRDTAPRPEFQNMPMPFQAMGSMATKAQMRPAPQQFVTNAPPPPEQQPLAPTQGAGLRQGFMDSTMFGAKRPRMSMNDILMRGASRARRR